MSLDGQHAMIQIGANQFAILDLQDPAEPRQVLKDTRHGLLYGDQMMRGLIHDRYTFIFWPSLAFTGMTSKPIPPRPSAKRKSHLREIPVVLR